MATKYIYWRKFELALNESNPRWF